MPLEISPYLQQVLERKRVEVIKLPNNYDSSGALIDRRCRGHAGSTSLLEMLQVPALGKVHLIAEFFRRGDIVRALRLESSVSAIAKDRNQAGVSAVSMLIDESFSGRPGTHTGTEETFADMQRVRKSSELPIIFYDFVINPVQIILAKHTGADEIALVAQILEPKQTAELVAAAREQGLGVLIEVSNHAELELAIEAGIKIIAINNRNWFTEEVNFRQTLELAKEIPEDRIIVSESGFNTARDVNIVVDGTRGRVKAILACSALMNTRSRAALIKMAKSLSGIS